MTVTFYDRQDGNNPLSGCSFTKSTELLRRLDELSSRPPFFCEIENENGFKLLVGIARSRSCVQYSAMNGSAPYLMALGREEQSGTVDVEFLMGNTLTPICHRYILKADLARKVIAFFIETGEKSALVDWQEI